jgi:short-subunit dehydrogenase
MTWGILKPNSPIVATPQKVARDIVRAIKKRKHTIYTPWFWWGIMTIIKSIPEFIFKKMKL